MAARDGSGRPCPCQLPSLALASAIWAMCGCAEPEIIDEADQAGSLVDLATPDRSAPPDLAADFAVQDLAMEPVDLQVAPDLSSPPDLTQFPDLIGGRCSVHFNGGAPQPVAWRSEYPL